MGSLKVSCPQTSLQVKEISAALTKGIAVMGCRGMLQGKQDPQGNLDLWEFSEVKIYGTCFDFARAIFGDFGLEGLLAYQSSRCTLWDIGFVWPWVEPGTL